MSRIYWITSRLGVYECLQSALVLGFLVVFMGVVVLVMSF